MSEPRIETPLSFCVDGGETWIGDATEKPVTLEEITAELDQLRDEVGRLERELSEARAWSESDAPLEIDDEVKAVKPSRDPNPVHAICWRKAQEYVSAKRSKYALVDLLSWAMIGRCKAERERDIAKGALLRIEKVCSSGPMHQQEKRQILDIARQLKVKDSNNGK